MKPAVGYRKAVDHPVSRAVEYVLEGSPEGERLRLAGTPYVPLPDHVRQAVAESLDGPGGYPTSRGELPLRAAITEWLAADRVEVTPDQVLVTNGAMQALDVVFRTLLEPGDEVLAPAPCFFIDGQVRRAGGRLVQFASGIEDGFRPDWERAKTLVTGRTRVLFVNTPVNPTGYVYDEGDLAALADLVESTGVTLVSDESSSHFVYGDRRHRSPALGLTVPGEAVVIRSFSKDYALPGMRIGFAALPAALYEAALATLEWAVLCVNRAAQAAALAALTGPQEWVDRMVRAVGARGAELADGLDGIDGITCRRPLGGLNVFPSFAGDADGLSRVLAANFGVPAFPGSAFGSEGYFRLQFGGRPDDLARAVARIDQAVARFPAPPHSGSDQTVY